MQHQHGHLTMKEIMSILKTKDEDILSKFIEDERGLFYNERLEIESEKRKKYVKSRQNNLLGASHMDTHMEDVNVNRDKDINTNAKSKKFIKPTPQEMQEYFESIDYKIDGIGQKCWDSYESKGWMIGKCPMKNWQAACRTWKSNGYDKNSGQPELKPQKLSAAARQTAINLGVNPDEL